MSSTTMPLDFWDALEQIVHDHPLVIDRTKGTPHPRHPNFIYPLDYGYLDGTSSQDGGGIDVWQGSQGGAGITAICCTADWHKRDAEVKILIDCSESEQRVILKVHNEASMRGMLVARSGEVMLIQDSSEAPRHELAPPAEAKDYWGLLDLFVLSHQFVIDRPKGSAHPRLPQFVYQVDYGYLQGTEAPDGDAIDVWAGSEPDLGLVAVCAVPDWKRGSIEMKLLWGCTANETKTIGAVHGKGLLISRES